MVFVGFFCNKLFIFRQSLSPFSVKESTEEQLKTPQWKFLPIRAADQASVGNCCTDAQGTSTPSGPSATSGWRAVNLKAGAVRLA